MNDPTDDTWAAALLAGADERADRPAAVDDPAEIQARIDAIRAGEKEGPR